MKPETTPDEEKRLTFTIPQLVDIIILSHVNGYQNAKNLAELRTQTEMQLTQLYWQRHHGKN